MLQKVVLDGTCDLQLKVALLSIISICQSFTSDRRIFLLLCIIEVQHSCWKGREQPAHAGLYRHYNANRPCYH